jgi:hypothetical protein
MLGLVARIGQVHEHFEVTKLVPIVCVNAECVRRHDLREKFD